MVFRPFLPLTQREKRALTIWGSIFVLLGALDYEERGRGTLSEGHRFIRRRIGKWGWRGCLAAFFVWFCHHTEND